MRQINVQAAAANLSAGIARSGPKWTAGIGNFRVAPNADPAAMTANWQAGVSAAAPKFQAAVSSAGFVAKWQANSTAKVSSYSGSGARAAATWATNFAPYAQQIQQVAATLKKGPKGTNSANATTFGQAMHNFKLSQVKA